MSLTSETDTQATRQSGVNRCWCETIGLLHEDAEPVMPSALSDWSLLWTGL